MEGAPSAAAAPAASTSTAAAAAPGRGGGDRGGRGRGRGAFQRGGRGGGRGGSSDRGRGGRGGGDRGRGRGDGSRGRGDGGLGRGRGRRGGFPSHRPARHRSLSGKHGARPRDGEPPAKREKKERKDQKPNSNFALLHSLLGDTAMIAEYIRDYHGSEKFRDPKLVNSFLQAISQRPDAVYEELMSQHKDAVFTVLERLFAIYALGKQTMFPSAHEFIIRCEQAGVRKSAWGEGVKTLPVKAPPQTETSSGADGQLSDGVAEPPVRAEASQLPAEAASLLSPRELIKKLVALDPVGRLQRLIELSSTVEDVQVCAKKLAALLEEEGGGEKFDYAAQCKVISKLLSKARRVVEPAFAPPPSTTAEEGTPAPAEEESDDEEGEAEEEHGVAAAKGATDEPTAEGTSAVAASPRPRRDPLTEEEIAAFQSALSTALEALETVLRNRAPNVPQQPLSKFSKVLEWCKAQGLMAAADERFIALLEEAVESDLAQQATQLETVITLKSLPSGDTAALTAVADQLWAAGDAKCFAPSSVDVLSAMAVAAGAPGISAEAKRLVADRLVQTQQHLADTVVLPRRALRFVNEERSKVKQAAITKQLEDEAANYGRTGAHGASVNGQDAGSGEDEEEDMALEEA